jgi:D-cysteine desulfhydrase family pyridoxal phosphate-dependent enzyme
LVCKIREDRTKEATPMDATRTAAGVRRLRLAHLPTPLEPLERLSGELGGPRIWVKRDDLTGLAGGGNKTRKLEFLLGDALDRGADTVMTAGAVQSNHARQTAAACARLGLRCELFLVEAAPGRGESYGRSGNVLLDRILGAKVSILPGSSDPEIAMEERAEALRAEGRRPYAIPVGGSNAVGALGYVECARELTDQAHGMSLRIDAVVHASASHGTQAGLAVGLAVAGTGARLLGVGVGGSSRQARANIERIAAATCERLGGPKRFAEIEVEDRFVGEGYGIPTPEGLAAIRLLARLEGLLLDPVYTGKAMAGLVEMTREGRFGPDQNVVFLHTGGWPALFAYEEELAERGAPR